MLDTHNILTDDDSNDLWQSQLSLLRVPNSRSQDEIWNRLSNLIIAKNKLKHTLAVTYWTLGIAASLVIILGIFYNASFKTFESQCLAAQIREVQLPDGSIATLNASSRLEYVKMYGQRKVYLQGEAFFRVKKGCKFVVTTSLGVVTVMGTTFNVFARDNQFKVYCQTGKVKVSANGSVILTPGMATSLEKDKLLKVCTLSDNHIGMWQHGEFWYHDTPLSSVVAELQRQFNVTITYPKDTERYYSGYFNRKSLDQALKNVFDPMQISYSVQKNQPNNN